MDMMAAPAGADATGSPPARRWLGALRSAVCVGALVGLVIGLAGCDSAERTPASPTGPEPGTPHETVDPAAIPPGGQFDAAVGRIHDGDSFDLRGQRERRIGVRIAGIDAPERRQPFSGQARRHLQDLAGGQRVTVHVLGHDRYGRIVGRVELRPPDATASGGERPPGRRSGRTGDASRAPVVTTDLGLAQIEAGLAWYYRRYESDLPAAWRGRYDAAESRARDERRGLWREPDPIAPWRFRVDRHRGATAPPATEGLDRWAAPELR